MSILVTPLSTGNVTPFRQGPARTLLSAFNEAGVSYCHWKSNQHLLDGLSGATDLDILVDRDHRERAQRLLADCGFKRFAPTIGMGYPAIEDYIGLDLSAGRLIHCHLHYRLVAGEAHLKGHRVPWEHAVLGTRIWNDEASAFTTCPELEMLILLVRYATKLRLRDRLFEWTGRRYVRGGLGEEYAWLRARLDVSRSIELCRELLGAEPCASYAALLDGDVTFAKILRFRDASSEELKHYRTYGSIGGRLIRWMREGAWIAAGVNRRWLRSAHPLRRTVPAGGIVIAFIGPDGSGKSTVTKAVASMLMTKLDVLMLYFGSGDGPSSLLRLPLRWMRLLIERPGSTPRLGAAASSATGSSSIRARVRDVGRLVWAIALSREKRKTLQVAARARNRGMVVITDRFPQTQFMGFNDGPLLARYAGHPSALMRRIARWEAEPYHRAGRQAPDLVLKLHTRVETALARKPETGRAEVERRLDALRQLGFPATTRVVDIDANLPLENVVRQASQAVWMAL